MLGPQGGGSFGLCLSWHEAGREIGITAGFGPRKENILGEMGKGWSTSVM